MSFGVGIKLDADQQDLKFQISNLEWAERPQAVLKENEPGDSQVACAARIIGKGDATRSRRSRGF